MAPSTSTYVQPAVITEGRLGHLKPEQIAMLQQFWVRLYDIFDGKAQFDQTAPSSFKGQARDEDAAAPQPEKKGWFGRGKKEASTSEKAPQEVAPRFTGEDLYKTFWKLTMMDHPDMIVLKFLRARKWVLDDAMKMFLNALKWRIVERLDELVELSDTMECGRMLVPEGTENVIVVFDLSDFGLDNMDWGFVRLFVQCFEAYYPETLGVCVVHRAPFVFWGLWKLIAPLLDPVVASKFVFTRNNAELHKQYARLTPYVRAKNLYQRWGVAVDGKVNWTYNVKAE
ncbi:hypothetical protein BGZ73_003037 [Actinomortierella ambigua]|nr:hypothetical protein BGZ73_003037 [Actinomortierella ambigua]